MPPQGAVPGGTGLKAVADAAGVRSIRQGAGQSDCPVQSEGAAGARAGSAAPVVGRQVALPYPPRGA
jgi:hypothetical protein